MRRDLVSGLFWLTVAMLAAAQGYSLKLGTLNRPGPGFFPFWGGVVLGLLSVVLVIDALRRDSADAAALGWSWKAPVVAGAVLGYILLLERLGFTVVTFLFLLGLLRLGRYGWALSGVSAALGAGATYVVFQLWLRTQLPAGPLGF
jgi:putative tricarboxylic transport membrane protein